MFSTEFETLKTFVEKFAKDSSHDCVLTEHWLYGLLHDDKVVLILHILGVDTKAVISKLTTYLKTYIPTTARVPDPIPHSPSCERMIRRAVVQLQSSGRQDRLVEPSDILVSLLHEHTSYGARLLILAKLDRTDLLRFLAHGNLDANSDTSEDGADDEQITPKSNNKPKSPKDPLTSFADNLNAKVKAGKVDPLIGRNAEMTRLMQILCRRRKNNPLLVGDAGVGKTAIAEGLAWLIVNQKVPTPLQDAVIYSLDVGALVAGTKFRGEFEARMKALLGALKKQPNAILFIDEIHSIIGAGSGAQSAMDMSDLIKPALASGEFRCIGSTTFGEFRNIFEKDGALSRRFQKIDIIEPSLDEAVQILQGLRPEYERYHGVRYTDDALQMAVELSAKHIHERFLPDKAIDVIDEAGARYRLKASSEKSDPNTHASNADNTNDENLINTTHIEAVVASIARIPENSVSKDDLTALKTLESDLKHMVFGQDEAIKRLVDAIILSRAGLKPLEKPIGSFMFAGPTGVGKTEIARQLAFGLGIPLVRFDMSEYMEAHTVSRLIGSPPGYVGHDKGGLLTEKIEQNPHAVLLLDELEKAHSDIYNILLQVMDYGKLTDNNGREVSFRQVILIMTTNVGADSISRNSMGFTHQDHSADNTEAMKKAFSPEFRNRLDAVVQFAPLAPEALSQVVDKFLIQLQAMLDNKNVQLNVSDEAHAYLMTHGYDRLMGARPMAHLIDDKIKKPLAHALLFGELTHGGRVTIGVKNDELVFEYQALNN